MLNKIRFKKTMQSFKALIIIAFIIASVSCTDRTSRRTSRNKNRNRQSTNNPNNRNSKPGMGNGNPSETNINDHNYYGQNWKEVAKNVCGCNRSLSLYVNKPEILTEKEHNELYNCVRCMLGEVNGERDLPNEIISYIIGYKSAYIFDCTRHCFINEKGTLVYLENSFLNVEVKKKKNKEKYEKNFPGHKVIASYDCKPGNSFSDNNDGVWFNIEDNTPVIMQFNSLAQSHNTIHGTVLNWTMVYAYLDGVSPDDKYHEFIIKSSMKLKHHPLYNKINNNDQMKYDALAEKEKTHFSKMVKDWKIKSRNDLYNELYSKKFNRILEINGVNQTVASHSVYGNNDAEMAKIKDQMFGKPFSFIIFNCTVAQYLMPVSVTNLIPIIVDAVSWREYLNEANQKVECKENIWHVESEGKEGFVSLESVEDVYASISFETLTFLSQQSKGLCPKILKYLHHPAYVKWIGQKKFNPTGCSF